jgi:hypothetical protein
MSMVRERSHSPSALACGSKRVDEATPSPSRPSMPDLRARETSLKDQIAALDAQAADRDAYLKLADNLGDFLEKLRRNAAGATTEQRQRVLRAVVQDILVGPEKSPSATASPSANQRPAAAATTTPPTRRVTCAIVRYCVGGVMSPVLSNIYLDRLDRFIEQDILPAYNRGARRTSYRPYMRLWQQACRLERRGEREAGRALRRQMKAMRSRDPADPGYRRLKYCRYADDWVLGFTGPRQEAEEIKDATGQFLREQLKLELSPAKTLITHGRTQAARSSATRWW